MSRLDLLLAGEGAANGASKRHYWKVSMAWTKASPRRKPMALLNLVYRDQLFPRRAYKAIPPDPRLVNADRRPKPLSFEIAYDAA